MQIDVIVVTGTKDAPIPRPNKRRRVEDTTADPGPSSRPHVQKPDKNMSCNSARKRVCHGQMKLRQDNNEALGIRLITSPDTVFEQSDDKQKTSRLFLRSILFSYTKAEVMELSRPFEEVAQVHMPIDYLSKQSKGLIYVTFKQPTSAIAAYEVLDKASLPGHLLHIIPTVDRKGKFEVVEGEEKKQTFKDKRSSRREVTAVQEFNWSMLYVDSDAVASSIAIRMGIAKADLNQITRQWACRDARYPRDEVIPRVPVGRLTDIFRSDTTIPVKNIPYGTTVYHGMCQGFSSCSFGSSVMYLKKGPMGMFQKTVDAAGSSGYTLTTASKPIIIAEQEAGSSVDAKEPALSAGTTLLVKKLAFSTTPERLVQVFRDLPGFSFARVQTKPDPKRPTVPGAEASRLSMGYGFVGFKMAEDAKKAMKSIYQERENVPFEATKKDIRELFSAHSHIKSVRFPKKFNLRSCGFAFLEFLIQWHEAESAYVVLRHTYVLGRHLVLQWAEEAGQDIEVLRKKAGVGYGDGAILPRRKRKLEITGDDTGGNAERWNIEQLHLPTNFTTTIRRDASESCPRHQRWQIGLKCALEAICLARECNVPEILPASFYAFSILRWSHPEAAS
ncbi:hypothetical protein BDR04DRAFT_1233274 [Suillus decipiens]|nr:hypothetical protein BDR04DRAFT_1233274 [Suillus decipiens]